MLRELLGGTPLFGLPILAMGLFLSIFVAVLVRVSRKSRAPEYRRMAQLPLADDHRTRSDR